MLVPFINKNVIRPSLCTVAVSKMLTQSSSSHSSITSGFSANSEMKIRSSRSRFIRSSHITSKQGIYPLIIPKYTARIDTRLFAHSCFNYSIFFSSNNALLYIVFASAIADLYETKDEYCLSIILTTSLLIAGAGAKFSGASF